MIKTGQQPLHPRLDLIFEKDERSRQFPVTAKLGANQDTPRFRTYSVNRWLDQGEEGACFPSGTLIRMADGSTTPIEEIRLLDEVVTAEGNIGKVLKLMVRESDEMLSVKMRGHNHLKCTPEHPILTDKGYIPAKDLQEGDLVALAKWMPETSTLIDTAKLVNKNDFRGTTSGKVNIGGVESNIAELPELIGMTPLLGRLLGLYAAEGWVTENKVCWSFNANERDTLVQETVDLLKSTLGIEARLQKRPNNSIYVNAYGKIWRVLFQNLITGTSKHGDKKLSPIVMSGPKEFLEALFWGWQDGDGHRRRTSVEGISVSHNLAMDMYNISQALGLHPTINESKPFQNEHAKMRQNRWSVTVAEGGGHAPKEDSQFVWRKVTSVTKVDFSGYVYNMHIHGDNSYIAEGVGVHNCVGFAFAHELCSTPLRVGIWKDIDYDWAWDVYHEAQHVDHWPGCILGRRCPVEPSSQSYEGTSILAGIKTIEKRGFIDEYHWAFGEEDLALAVSHLGPAVIGVNWYEGMFAPNRNNYIEPTGQWMGGHAVLVNSVNPDFKNPDLQYYRIWNSWGQKWGRNGWCYISRKHMAQLLSEDGEAVIPLVRNA